MAERNEAMAASLPNQDDVQFLSDSYDNLVQSKDDIAQDLLNLNRRLVELKKDVGRIDKAVDELLYPNEILRTVMAAKEDSPIQSSASLQGGWYVTRSWLRGVMPLN